MIRLVWSGVDWLEATFDGKVSADSVERLTGLRTLAENEHTPQAMRCGDLALFVPPYGLRPWKWLAECADLSLRLGDSDKIPPASVHLLAEGLATYGHEGAYQLALDSLATLGTFVGHGVTRIDLAADYQGFPFTDADFDNVSCRATYRGRHGTADSVQTFQFGRDQLVARIYNKTEELKKSGKLWLREAWGQSDGFDPAEDVWRFEAQLRRDGLRSFDCRTVEETFANLSGLFGSMLDWCRLTVPGNQQLCRRPTDPPWQELAATTFAGVPIPRVKQIRFLGQYDRLVPQAFGVLVSAAARLNIKDFHIAAEVLNRSMWDRIQEEQIDFAQQVERRIAERADR
jgi:hypothetical protein